MALYKRIPSAWPQICVKSSLLIRSISAPEKLEKVVKYFSKRLFTNQHTVCLGSEAALSVSGIFCKNKEFYYKKVILYS